MFSTISEVEGDALQKDGCGAFLAYPLLPARFTPSRKEAYESP
jgi:hypothetical protein